MDYEQKHLDDIKNIIKKEIEIVNKQIESKENDLNFARSGLGEETSHAIGGSLYSAESFEQLVELSQFATEISDITANQELSVKQLERLKQMVLKPYFARIDFQFPEDDETTPIYIGRYSLMEEVDILIHDWRSPIAGLFYQYGLGEASYSAPIGTITGVISLKRQYEIRNGKLEFYFDTNVEVLDEYLQRLLSQNASSYMRSIVETIQKEQDTAIRDDKNNILIIQGVAGSGKTSVALHRIAYLMYKGLEDRITNRDVVIISPNRVFEKYIANVLPELGESNVRSYIIEELYEKIVKKMKLQTRFNLMEQILSDDNRWATVAKKSYEYKCSREFTKILSKVSIFEAENFKDILEIYKYIFENPQKLKQLAEEAGVNLPQNMNDLIQYTNENLTSKKLFFDDAAAVIYLYLRKFDVAELSSIKQVVIDEAQDYYPLHFRIFKLLFPTAKYTILGDINQTINKPENMKFYDEILSVMNREPSSIVTLNKSFRCTREITQFSSEIIGEKIDSFGRHGTTPSIIRVENDEDIEEIINDVKTNLKEGKNSIGIICKSMKDCKILYKKLKEKIQIKIFDDSMDEDIEGVFTLPIYLAKGLEFDISFIWGAYDSWYGNKNDENLLYIACTRALHELRLYLF